MESQARDMDESQNTQGGLVNRVLSEIREIDEPTGSGINDGSDSVVQGNVGVNAVDASLKPMTVEVHQPGTDVFPLEIQNLGTCAGIQIGPKTQDSAVFNPDIKDSIDGLRGVDHVTLFEQ